MDESKTNKKNQIYLIIGIIIGLALVIIISSIVFHNKSYRNNDFIGTWDCKGIGKTAKGDNYVLTIKFDNNNKFIFGTYAELDKDSTKGTYVIKENDKKGTYTIVLSFNKKEEELKATLSKENDKTIAVLTDVDDASYKCYLTTKKNPNLK